MAGRFRRSQSFAARIAVCGLFAALTIWVAAAPRLAFAGGRVQFLADRLRFPPADGQPDDFRVRTNAALALGATDDDSAVAPLCGGLDDPNELVRQAAAVALRRLARGSSVECLRKRVAVETVPSAKQQMQRALEACEASGGATGGAPASTDGYVAGAKYYVSISPVANNTTRSRVEVESTVRRAISARLAQLGEYQLAPAGESNQVAKSVIAKRKLKGFYLSVSVDKIDYSDGELRVRLKIAVFSYPSKDLRGEVPAEATLTGARPGDSGGEDQLIGAVATRAAELFALNFR